MFVALINTGGNYMESGIHEIADKVKRKYHSIFDYDCMEKRQYNEEVRRRAEGEYQRDYSRIMYSSSFRRLQGKMQLLGIKNDQFFRNRLTHSLEVAQIARSVAAELKYGADELFVVEAGALAHDIGNPPFGHAGEHKLNELFEDVGGFEGNAQTLRILTNLEKKKPEFVGLNLSYRTLLSVVKYFNKHRNDNNEENEKFIYDDDYCFLKKYVDDNKIQVRTIDVQIVDLADEIAYAAHDLEDGLRVKAYIIDEILHEYYSLYGNSVSYQKLEKLVGAAKEKSGFGLKNIDSTEFCKLFRQELSSSIIFTLISDIGLVKTSDEFKKKTGTRNDEKLDFLNYKELADGLKKITFRCINNNNEVYNYEQKGKKLLEYLKDFYMENTNFLPPEYRAQNLIERYNYDQPKKQLQARLICDYISGMMDSYAINTYEQITGKSFNNILG